MQEENIEEEEDEKVGCIEMDCTVWNSGHRPVDLQSIPSRAPNISVEKPTIKACAL